MLDQWILSLWETTKEKIFQAYNAYEFARISQLVGQFCSVSLSAHYFDMIKDRLYTSIPDSNERRYTQATIRQIAQELLLCLSPILVFTTDEIGPYLFGKKSKDFSVHFEPFPPSRKTRINKSLESKMEGLLAFRGEIGQMMDELKKAKSIGSGLETQVFLSGNISEKEGLNTFSENFLSTFLIVSDVHFGDHVPPDPLDSRESETFPGIRISLHLALGQKCERCWTFSESTSENSEKWPVCSRCYPIVVWWGQKTT